MSLEDDLRGIQDGLRRGIYPDEAAISKQVVLRLLQALGWKIFDPSSVKSEYSVPFGTGRVDYALCYPKDKPAIFIEVKSPHGQLDRADPQLFGYAFHQGVPMAASTNGQEWHFYLPGAQGDYTERRVYALDILERDLTECADRLCRYMSFENVSSGKYLEYAREDYDSKAKEREINGTLPVAWSKLLNEQDSLLIDLIAEEVESLCGYKPEPDRVVTFLENQSRLISTLNAQSERKIVDPPKILPPKGRGIGAGENSVWFNLHGQDVPASNLTDLLVKSLEEISKKDPDFPARFAARPKHGRKRRFIAQNKEDLYPDRPDLAAQHAKRLSNGWWIGTNNSKTQVEGILRMACEVAGIKFGEEFTVHLG